MADQKAADKKKKDGPKEDLLEETKSLEEALFACMYALVKEKGKDSWQYSYTKVVLEGLIATLIIFNPSRAYWAIDESFWFWKIIRWVTYRQPIVALWGYSIYTLILYVIVAVLGVMTIGLAALAWLMMKGHENSKYFKFFAMVLQLMADVAFNVFYMSTLDYLMYTTSCHWSSNPIVHSGFPDVQCLSMSYIIVMAVGVIGAIVFIACTVVFQAAGCDLNPCAHGILASPAAGMKIKVVITKAIMVVCINACAFSPKIASILTSLCVLIVFWSNFKSLPFFQTHINMIWCGMWLSINYTAALWLTMAFMTASNGDYSYQRFMTLNVLYGVFPVLVGGICLTGLWSWYRMRPVKNFLNVDPEIKLKKIYRFGSAEEVELLARAMRNFNLDLVIDPDSADIGELIIKAGLATFPSQPSLLILYANFMMEVRKDGPASRTQLALVSKAKPGFVVRYQAFCTVQTSKRLKENSEQGMDLHSYVECKRLFRAVLRAHKSTLMQLREFWSTMQKPEPRASKIEAALKDVDKSIEHTYRVYQKVVERYPKHGKLLKCYGTFLEDVKNDFKNATKVYAEATRQGGAGNGILSMEFDFASEPGKPEMLIGMDVNEDAIIIINAEGVILVVSAGVTPLFGYAKAELEGANVSMLMPQPFQARHASYLQRYKDDPDHPRILDSVKEVVALHKERTVFPVSICVTKLSGVGADAIFLGLLRPLSFSRRDIRAWLAPNGTIMCCGPMFAALTGIESDTMVGSNVKSLVSDPKGLEQLMTRGITATSEEFESGSLAMSISILNKYTGAIPVNIHLSMGGTEQTRLLVMHLERVEDLDDNLLVVDEEGEISFATIDLAITLGYSYKEFKKLKLKDLLPIPTNSMHAGFLRDAPPAFPPTSCRSGAIVHMVSSTNQHVPVRLQHMQREEPSGLKHVTRITKAAPHEFQLDRHMQILCLYDGTIVSVETDNAIFGFPSRELKGLNVCDVLDVFTEWKVRSGGTNMNLLLLALLDKENEMPGAAWRVKLNPPEAKDLGLPGHNGHVPGARTSNVAGAKRLPRSVIMQTAIYEVAKVAKEKAKLRSPTTIVAAQEVDRDDRPRIALTLWKRELLVGHMEVDDELKITRADQLCGIIMGRPALTIMRKPLHKFLTSITPGSTWHDVFGGKKGKSKSPVAGVGKICMTKALEGHHPDGGNMRLLIQGAEVVDPANPAKHHYSLSVKPDMNFIGGHSDIWAALGLDNLDEKAAEDDDEGSNGSGADDAEEDREKSNFSAKALTKLAADKSADAPGAGIANWIKSVPVEAVGVAPSRKSIQFDPELDPEADGPRSRRMSMEDGPRAKNANWMKLVESMPEEAGAVPGPANGRKDKDGKGGSSDDGHSDGGSSAGEGASGYSASAAGTVVDEILVDSRRGKVMRKITTLLHNIKMSQPVEVLKICTYIICAIILLLRVVCFFIATADVYKEIQHIHMVMKTAQACDRTQLLGVKTDVMIFCQGLTAAEIAQDSICHTIADPTQAIAAYHTAILELEEFAQEVYLGIKKVSKIQDKGTYNAWSEANMNLSIYLDTNPPVEKFSMISLWSLNTRYISACREILWQFLYIPTAATLSSRAYNFIMENSFWGIFNGFTEALDNMMVYAYSNLNHVKSILVCLFVIEALVTVPLILLWLWYLVRKAESVRICHWTIMATLPPATLQQMTTKSCRICNDSDDESEVEDGEGAEEAPKAAERGASPPAAGPASTHAQHNGSHRTAAAIDAAKPVVPAVPSSHAQHKTVSASLVHYFIFLVPMALWLVGLIALYAISLIFIETIKQPLAALNMAMHVTYRFSHLRIAAFRFASQSTDAGRDFWKVQLQDAVANLTSEYDTLMYGGVASTQQGDLFKESVPAATFILPSFSNMFFSATTCFRKDQSTCYAPTSPWYEITHHGLDAMMTRVLDEMKLMTKDDYADVVYNSSRYNAVYHVGITDLYEGLQQAATTFVDYAVSKYQLLILLQIIMLIVSIGTCGLYIWLVLRPYLRLHKVQTTKVAGLLSHVPTEHCDVNGHTRRSIRRMGEKHAKKANKGPQLQQSDLSQNLLLAPSANSISASQDGGPSNNSRWV